MVAAHLRPWSGVGFRHIPAGSSFGVLDTSFAARATANFVRRTSTAEGLIVPSMAFLDDPVRWNLVLFLERLPNDLTTFITVAFDGTFRTAPT